MYRLPQFDIGWQKYADLFRLERNDKDRERDAFDNIPPEIFASKALLAYGIRTDTFDLVPTVRNYEKLIDNVSHTSYPQQQQLLLQLRHRRFTDDAA